ncbi:P-loop containing nucleoside triphosphate hydrolase protein [Sodiomyces alkalinus F11]|uniref:P-loop containing nucleoside triphosphate hydrolase protein n=1 Tax=Sodiomyces alkalinus (strain CBS 110278 / VKM F-3762 / F11) TaxID=1314773 RepID=A0A3N2Q8W9_SODAK|nr:P-loop containing nucleoside triphosphate hydrolase protein [Sodiomyces alkalinus F11]ROT43229.1 P-loop containing nucleoside triphosphate hydrolase protein [Sodiomyces alkalinus F11]
MLPTVANHPRYAIGDLRCTVVKCPPHIEVARQKVVVAFSLSCARRGAMDRPTDHLPFLVTADSPKPKNDPPYATLTMAPKEALPTIETSALSYTFPDYSTGISDITLSLPVQSRTLLIGANGAGKTTLLRLLAGKRLAPANTIAIGGVDPFKEGLEGVTYLGLEWVLNPIVRTDISVTELLRSVGGDAYPERRDELIGVLDIDTRWRMHAVSDGERRRVQLAMGLIRPWTVLLLDEITVDLDVLSRANFLSWLRAETEKRVCTIVYATHILDNLAGWPTHLVHMHLGTVREWGPAEQFLEGLDARSGNSTLGELVLGWLRQDLKDRGPRTKVVIGPEGKTYDAGGYGGYGDESHHMK